MSTLCSQLNLPYIQVEDWTKAFELLAAFTKDKDCLLFLDEISWLGAWDKNFSSKLKVVWDTKFKENNKLILVLCGSVTTWINKNILNSTGFVGRISLLITLTPLTIAELRGFFPSGKINDLEILKIISITGGIPRYLKEIDHKSDAEANIKRLCFHKEGILFNEFEQIFTDIFQTRSQAYRQILKVLQEQSLSATEIAKKLSIQQSGILTQYLDDLAVSGFIRRDFAWNLKTGENSKLSVYRISDNYLRFYLKHIEPQIKQIKLGLFEDQQVSLPIKNLESVVGIQLEILIYNNILDLIYHLGIQPSSIVNFGPLFQSKTERTQACQIDLLIQTNSAYYVGEIKYREKIGINTQKEVQDKISKLKLDKTKSIKTLLIYAGTLSQELIRDDYFDFKVKIPTDLWENKSKR